MNIFEMWIDGVKIIISFIPIGIAMILLPLSLCFSFDLLIEAISGEAMWVNILFGCKTYKELWDKLKQKIKNRRQTKK